MQSSAMSSVERLKEKEHCAHPVIGGAHNYTPMRCHHHEKGRLWGSDKLM